MLLRCRKRCPCRPAPCRALESRAASAGSLPKPYSSEDRDYSGPVINLEPYKEPYTGPKPVPLWNYSADSRLEQAPLQTQDLVFLAGVDGVYFGTSKYDGRQQYRFKAEAALSAPPGQYGDVAYVASQDFNVYAIDMVAGQILWRFTGGAPILRKPEVLDEDMYVAPQRVGLYRLRRVTGEEIWHARDAKRFLAANKKFVYATDHSNRLLILDRARGTRLTTFDTHDYAVPVSNELTDRFFLASNDGLLVCLHDRDFSRPLLMKKVRELQPIGGSRRPDLRRRKGAASQQRSLRPKRLLSHSLSHC